MHRRIYFQLVVVLSLLFGMVVFAVAAPGATRIVKEQEIRLAIEDFIRAKTSNLGVELNIRKIGYKGDLTIPSGDVEYEVKAPQQWEGWGNSSLAVIIRVDNRVVKNIPVRVEVEALADVVVTTRQMEQGEVISETDVAIQKRDLASVGSKICRNPSEAVGKRLKRSVRGNAALQSDQMGKLPLVKSGQLVTILLENELIRVTATGRSKGAGAAGDIVMVQNLVSQKDVQARVLDSSTVRVEF